VSARITAIVVTHARRELLRECLHALHAQTRALDRILVVDNASSDGTAAMLHEEFAEVDVLRSEENTGSAGGYHAGVRAAAQGCDWMWLLDDDTIARPDALERLIAGLDRVPPGPPPWILAGRVEWRDGRPHPTNLPTFAQRDAAELVAAVERRMLPLRATSFVSVLIDARSVERYGPPEKAFFYQADDIDYTATILREQRGFFVTDSVVEHRTAAPLDPGTDTEPRRFYFHARNNLWMLGGPAWRRAEKPATVWFVLVSSARFARANRFSRESLATLWRAARDGRRRPRAD
jgi:GT2 family glycosyltransferase